MPILSFRLSSSSAIASAALVSQLLLVGCGKDEARKYDGFQYNQGASSSSETPAEPHRIEAESEPHALMLAKNAQVTCSAESHGGCHPAVGMLVEYTAPTEVGQCTAFLISPNIAMTNSHCIPEDLKREGSDCSGRMWLYFPELDHYEQTRVGCERVLTASQLSDKARDLPDYAVIQLDQAVARPALKISRDGFKNDSYYHIMKVNPLSQSAVVGQLEPKTCVAKHDSVLVSNSSSDLSATMAFSDCDIYHGNSGSPLIDPQGNVRGLIQSTFNPNGPSHFQSQLPMLEYEGNIRLGVGTSLACLDLPTEVQAPSVSPQCAAATAAPTDKNAALHALEQRVAGEIQRRLKAKNEELDPVFQWTTIGFSNLDKSYRFITVPECIRDMNALLARHHGWFSDYESHSEDKLDLQSMNAQVGVDRYLKLDYRVQSEPEAVSGVLSFSASDLAKNGSVSYEIEQKALLVVSLRLTSGTLKACEKPASL